MENTKKPKHKKGKPRRQARKSASICSMFIDAEKKYDDFKIIISVCNFAVSPTPSPSQRYRNGVIRFRLDVLLCNWFSANIRCSFGGIHFVFVFAYKSVMTLTKAEFHLNWNLYDHNTTHTGAHTHTHVAWAWSRNFECTYFMTIIMNTEFIFWSLSLLRNSSREKEIESDFVVLYTHFRLPYLFLLLFCDSETLVAYFIFKSVIFDNTILLGVFSSSCVCLCSFISFL